MALAKEQPLYLRTKTAVRRHDRECEQERESGLPRRRIDPEETAARRSGARQQRERRREQENPDPAVRRRCTDQAIDVVEVGAKDADQQTDPAPAPDSYTRPSPESPPPLSSAPSASETEMH